MILLTIENSKDFMGKFLVTDVFDGFELQEAVITTSVSYTISGRIHPEFFSDEERASRTNEFISWKEIRPVIFEMIKGRNTPLSFRFTLSLNSAAMNGLIKKESPEGPSEALRALVMTVRFENGAFFIVTGSSYETFVFEREEEKIWDRYLPAFLAKAGIDVTAQQ